MQKGNNKMGKLSKAKNLTQTEKFCIEGMLSNDMSVAEIAQSLGRDEEQIEEYTEELERLYNQSNPAIINETLQGNKGVAIMTEEASQRIDEARKEAPQVKTTISKVAIHRIHD